MDELEVEYDLAGNPIIETETETTDVSEPPADAVVEDDITEEETEYPEVEAGTVSKLRESLEQLLDMDYTIDKLGVSMEDMQVLSRIQDDLVSMGIELPGVPSLEDYQVALFTIDRSTVNMSVAQESFGRTIKDVIRTMIRKLIEYVNKFIRWVRSMLMDESKVKMRIRNAIKRIEVTRRSIRELERGYGTPSNYDELRDKVLDHILEGLNPLKGARPLNDVSAGLLGDTQRVSNLKHVLKEVDSEVAVIPRTARYLETVLKDRHVEHSSLTVPNTGKLESLVSQAALLEVQLADPKTVLQDINRYPFEVRLNPELTGFTPYIHMLKAYEEAHDIVRKVKVDDSTEELEGAGEVLNVLTKGLDELSTLLQFGYRVNVTRIDVLNLIYTYESRRFTMLFNHAKENIVDSKVVDRVRDTLANTIKSTLG